MLKRLSDKIMFNKYLIFSRKPELIRLKNHQPERQGVRSLLKT